MNKTYSTYIENLKGRRYDEVLHGPSLSDSFDTVDYPEPVKYALEAMQEIDPSYSYKLFQSFRSTQTLITNELKARGIKVFPRYQGPHNTNTHIELYGDLELILVLEKYDKPSKSVERMSTEVVDILTNSHAYNMIDYSERSRIHVQTRKPVCNVSIVPAIWVESNLYHKTHLEINRGICEYNFSRKTRRIYLPFLNMARLNARNRKLSGSLKSMVRLLRSLMRDTEENINITHDELVGILYNMSIREMAVPHEQYLSLLPNINLQLNRLITDTEYREKLLSPGRKEYVFGKRQKKVALQQLKNEIEEFIADLNESLKPMNKSILSSFDY